MYNILVIDDEPSILTAMQFALEDEYKVQSTTSVTEGMELLNTRDIDLVLLDQRLGEYNGLEVLQAIKQDHPGMLVIIMTAYGSIESSVEAMQKGAYYYVTKPLDLPSLRLLIAKAMDYQNLSVRVTHLTKQLDAKYGSGLVVGKSKAITNVFELVDKIKDIDINVLITGESGTGKELVTKAIHYSGKRAKGPLETVNCAAIPYSLLESELFGYERGAFTGAMQKRKGKFELAHNGTLFFDEVGDMELALQAKLLRVIQEKRVTPLGSERSVPVDVRFVAATNKNLATEIKKGNFREDLYFRLNVIPLRMPPLRERREDIPVLTRHFIEKYSLLFNKKVVGVTASVSAFLENYDYPGNVRELENVIERAVALTSKDTIQVQDLPKEVVGHFTLHSGKDWIPVYIGETIEAAKRKVILATLDHFQGDRYLTAEVLGMSERHLRTKIKDYLIDE